MGKGEGQGMPGPLRREDRRVNVVTVDEFQGDEDDVVIVSMTRNNQKKGIGFLSKRNRRCVAQSRARSLVVFVGNAATFRPAPVWGALVNSLSPTSTLQLSCDKHKGKARQLSSSTPDSLDPSAELSLCGELCGCVKECRLHECRLTCHGDNESFHKADLCTDSVQMVCEIEPDKHKWTVQCRVREEDGSRACKFPVSVTCQKCHRPGKTQCSLRNEPLDCQRPCLRTLSCGHVCPNRCGERCLEASECSVEQLIPCPRDPSHKELKKHCNQQVDRVVCHSICNRPLACAYSHPCTQKCSDPCLDPDKCRQCERLREVEERKLEEMNRDVLRMIHEEGQQELRKLERTNIVRRRITHEDPDWGDQYLRIKDLTEHSALQAHHGALVVVDIEVVVNASLTKRFHEAKRRLRECRHTRPHQLDPELLFHGTTAEATDAICKTGFRLPERKDTNMFGQGVYFARNSTKSAQRLYTKGSGLLIVCEVVKGRVLNLSAGFNTKMPKSLSDAVKKNSQGRWFDVDLSKMQMAGFDSVMAPRETTRHGGVRNDELIIYDEALALPKFVVRFDTSTQAAVAPPRVLSSRRPLVDLTRPPPSALSVPDWNGTPSSGALRRQVFFA
uniref:Poly [ADP-ribose] polymerase n=1 Tax=Chromera velia CCMP2878 TaxID=1169474 RepID=A0A0G4F1Y3_9ALVE|eukprot:Cvel_14751.t1-p1 / transcript=Cvel_14751.t1 / gene=Cvel_14751 / organism=Chromera_velia_CCMP2878 / gene_product=NFX1-type zinc finger-containing protein 1, putative / transcript_product=NFX1-type zinc finger-containing protein 1, putative / location=Cvel_scaffold1061:41612-43456(-) / protein_length=615 / sequence_SO=supercontig / SO=protein_coding / is_pseudo=false